LPLEIEIFPLTVQVGSATASTGESGAVVLGWAADGDGVGVLGCAVGEGEVVVLGCAAGDSGVVVLGCAAGEGEVVVLGGAVGEGRILATGDSNKVLWTNGKANRATVVRPKIPTRASSQKSCFD
jgi:hypothetical protein